MSKYTLFFFIFFFVSYYLPAQKTWNLEECISYAQNNALKMKQANLGIRKAVVNEQQAQKARLPSVDFNSGIGFNLGRGLDYSTNAYINQNVLGNNLAINAGIILFNGGKIRHNIAQSKINTQVAQKDKERMENTIALSVTNAYLQILQAEEQVINAKKRHDQIIKELEHLDKLIASGTRAANDRFELQTQLARTARTLINNQNLVETAYLDLKQLLELAPDFDLKIAYPKLDIAEQVTENEVLTLKYILDKAIELQPQIKLGELRKKSAELAINIAKADLMPTISLGVSLNTQYANTNKKEVLIKQGEDAVRIPQILYFATNASQPVAVFVEQPAPNQYHRVDISYFEQIKNNLGKGISLSISYPIYNNGRAKANIERTQIDVENQSYENQQTLNHLKTEIQRAIIELKSAGKLYVVSKNALEASQTSYQSVEKRFRAGSASAYELSAARSTLDATEIELSISKFDYIFKAKVVDFYQGKKLSFQ